MATRRYPFFSKREMISPTIPRSTPSGCTSHCKWEEEIKEFRTATLHHKNNEEYGPILDLDGDEGSLPEGTRNSLRRDILGSKSRSITLYIDICLAPQPNRDLILPKGSVVPLECRQVNVAIYIVYIPTMFLTAKRPVAAAAPAYHMWEVFMVRREAVVRRGAATRP